MGTLLFNKGSFHQKKPEIYWYITNMRYWHISKPSHKVSTNKEYLGEFRTKGLIINSNAQNLYFTSST